MKKESTKSIMKSVFKKRAKEINDMRVRHPWFDLVYTWVLVILIISLGMGCIGWAMDVRTERRAAALTATAMAEYQAEQSAAETARMEEMAAAQASETAIMTSEAEWIAKLFYGIDRFVNVYNYNETDLLTYARCVFNRVESEKYFNTVEQVVNQEDQWTGYFDNLPVLKNYYRIALKAVEEWHSETIKPCSTEYLWAELTPNGIWLKDDFKADGYKLRWRYGMQ